MWKLCMSVLVLWKTKDVHAIELHLKEKIKSVCFWCTQFLTFGKRRIGSYFSHVADIFELIFFSWSKSCWFHWTQFLAPDFLHRLPVMFFCKHARDLCTLQLCGFCNCRPFFCTSCSRRKSGISVSLSAWELHGVVVIRQTTCFHCSAFLCMNKTAGHVLFVSCLWKSSLLLLQMKQW